jgi:CelD/BcsL family acetyltransferase involved in cellulose biosynthesis
MTRDEWWDLWRRDPRATPFQSPAWIDAWWAHLGGGERLDLEARDAAGKLIGALPMTVWNDAGTRKLVPVAAGQSDYSDALVDPSATAEALAGLWDAMLACTARWDEVLRPASPLLRLGAAWNAAVEPGEVCPVLTLPAQPPLLPQLTKTQRRKVVHDRHRAEGLGDVITAFAEPHEIDEALTALFDLHAARWRLKGEEGVLADSRVQAFHRAAAPALAEAGLLRLTVVRHAGRIVSALLAFADAHRGYSYVIGSDFSVPKQSFGTLAFAHLIEACVADGAAEFHFLRGGEPYKYGWGAEPTRTLRRTIRRR